MSELKLEVGKTYLTREGRKVKIDYNNSDGAYPFIGDNEMTYTIKGQWSRDDYDINDLIEEVEEMSSSTANKAPMVEEVATLKEGNYTTKKWGADLYIKYITKDSVDLSIEGQTLGKHDLKEIADWFNQMADVLEG